MERGTAKTDKFLIGSCSMLIGAVGDPASLDESNSMGLVKDVTLEFTPTYTDLQQGVENKTIFSVKTGNDTRITGTSYEFTDHNLAYAAGLNGDDIEVIEGTPYTVTAAADDSGVVSLTVDDPTKPVVLAKGDTVVLHSKEFSVITEVVDASELSTQKLKVAGDWHAKVTEGAKVTKVNVLALGRKQKPAYYSAKLVGELPNGDVAVVLVPKAQFKSGLSMAFTTSDFSNLNMELAPMALLQSDEAYKQYGDDLLRVAMAAGVSA